MKQEKNQSIVSLMKNSIIMNFFYNTFLNNLFKKITESNLFNKYLNQIFHAFVILIISSLTFLLSFYWFETLFLYLTFKSFLWFRYNYVVILQNDNDLSKLFEYYCTFFVLALVRSISCVSVHYLPTFIISCSSILTIKLMSDQVARKYLYSSVQNKLSKPLDEIDSVAQLFCHTLECAFNCAKNSPKIYKINKIQDNADFVNKLNLLVTDDTNQLHHNDSDKNDTNSTNDTHTNDTNTNDTNSTNDTNDMNDVNDVNDVNEVNDVNDMKNTNEEDETTDMKNTNEENETTDVNDTDDDSNDTKSCDLDETL